MSTTDGSTPCSHHNLTLHSRGVIGITPSAAREEIMQKRLRLQEKINILRTKQAPLLQHLNDIQSSANSLPPEVLSRIFELYSYAMYGCSEIHESWDSRYIHSPLKLAAVSAYWRTVAISTPQLWTSLTLYLCCECNHTHGKSPDKIAFARHFFELARGHPLSLTFDLEDFPDYHYTRTIDNYDSKIADIRAIIYSVVKDYAAQLARLELKGFGGTRGETSWAMWLSQLTRDKNLRQLKSLVILDAHSAWWWDWVIPESPSLQRLCLNTSLQRPITLSKKTITCLHLYRVAPPVCLELLNECRDTLIEYMQGRGRFQADMGWEHTFDHHYTITLPHLQIFHWSLVTYNHVRLLSHHDRYILHNLDMPSLLRLSLDMFDPEEEITTLPNTFSRINKTLDNLEITSNPRSFTTGLGTLLGMVDTRRLVLRLDRNRNSNDDVVSIFETLAKDSCVPMLQAIILRLTSNLVSVRLDMSRADDETCSAFLSMLEKRTAKDKSKAFKIDLRLDREVVEEIWEDGNKKRLKDLLDTPNTVQVVNYIPETNRKTLCCRTVFYLRQ